MKTSHFPKKHPYARYCEKGDNVMKSFFGSSSQTIGSADTSMMSIEGEDLEEAETLEESVLIDEAPQSDVFEEAFVRVEMPNNLKRELMDMFEPILQKNLEEIVCKKLDEMKLQEKEIDAKKDSRKDGGNADMISLRVKSSRTITDLCTLAGLTVYKSDNQLVCDLCDEASESATRKAGEFSYDFEEVGTDFSDVNLPKKFRSLKEHVVLHLNSKTHQDAETAQLENDTKESADEVFNYKVGKKLAIMIYSNVKERNSYAKYERDVAQAASNGEEVEFGISNILVVISSNILFVFFT